MIQQERIRERLSISVTPEEHKKIKRYAARHGYSVSKYILDCIRERMNQENEEKDLLKLTTSINPVLKELWDNEMDAAYDGL